MRSAALRESLWGLLFRYCCAAENFYLPLPHCPYGELGIGILGLSVGDGTPVSDPQALFPDCQRS